MLYSPARKQVWLHNPKVAGMSLNQWLQTYYDYEPVVPKLDTPVDPVNHPNGVHWRHAWIAPPELASRGPVETWCMVRHPLRRWESFYNFIRTTTEAKSRLTFDEFTAEHLSWLPSQETYVSRSDYWFPIERMTDGLSELGLVYKLQQIPRNNTTGFFVVWTPDTYERVVEHFRGDFKLCGYRIPTVKNAESSLPERTV